MNKYKGFTILEILISLSIGLFLFAGVMLVFEGMNNTTRETSSYGGMQETGRVTISMLSDDLMRQGFFGDMYNFTRSNLRSVPGAPVIECTGAGLNNGTFPGALGTFRTLWGTTAAAANNMGCITNAVIGSDILQLKRVVAFPVAGIPAGNFYLISNTVEGEIVAGGGVFPVINNSRTWVYRHHVYYVSEDTVGGNNIPILNIRQLATTMATQPLIDGVERLKFMYGVDTDDDGVVDAFIGANNMTNALWDGSILAVKIYVLVRDIEPDNDYTNNTVYQLGDTTFVAPGDNFRRMLFSSTITLHNGEVVTW